MKTFFYDEKKFLNLIEQVLSAMVCTTDVMKKEKLGSFQVFHGSWTFPFRITIETRARAVLIKLILSKLIKVSP